MEFKPLDGRTHPRFSGLSTFFRLPHHPEVTDLDVAVFGVPWDGAVTFRPGARFGPRAIREASCLVRGYSPAQEVSVFEALRVADAGDIPVVPPNAEATAVQIAQAAERTARAGAVPLCVGGDHSISLPLLRGLARVHGPLGMVHLDAHTDTYPAAWGSDFHHGTPFRKAVEEGLLDPKRVIQIGLRGGWANARDFDFARQAGFALVFVDDVARDGLGPTLERVRGLGGRVYVSVDVDGVDPAFAPGTGTPVPGGLSSREAIAIVRAVRGLDLVGFDVVEVSPPYDVAGITALLAAQLAFEFLAALAATRKDRRS